MAYAPTFQLDMSPYLETTPWAYRRRQDQHDLARKQIEIMDAQKGAMESQLQTQEQMRQFREMQMEQMRAEEARKQQVSQATAIMGEGMRHMHEYAEEENFPALYWDMWGAAAQGMSPELLDDWFEVGQKYFPTVMDHRNTILRGKLTEVDNHIAGIEKVHKIDPSHDGVKNLGELQARREKLQRMVGGGEGDWEVVNKTDLLDKKTGRRIKNAFERPPSILGRGEVETQGGRVINAHPLLGIETFSQGETAVDLLGDRNEAGDLPVLHREPAKDPYEGKMVSPGTVALGPKGPDGKPTVAFINEYGEEGRLVGGVDITHKYPGWGNVDIDEYERGWLVGIPQDGKWVQNPLNEDEQTYVMPGGAKPFVFKKENLQTVLRANISQDYGTLIDEGIIFDRENAPPAPTRTQGDTNGLGEQSSAAQPPQSPPGGQGQNDQTPRMIQPYPASIHHPPDKSLQNIINTNPQPEVRTARDFVGDAPQSAVRQGDAGTIDQMAMEAHRTDFENRKFEGVKGKYGASTEAKTPFAQAVQNIKNVVGNARKPVENISGYWVAMSNDPYALGDAVGSNMLQAVRKFAADIEADDANERFATVMFSKVLDNQGDIFESAGSAISQVWTGKRTDTERLIRMIGAANLMAIPYAKAIANAYGQSKIQLIKEARIFEGAKELNPGDIENGIDDQLISFYAERHLGKTQGFGLELNMNYMRKLVRSHLTNSPTDPRNAEFNKMIFFESAVSKKPAARWFTERNDPSGIKRENYEEWKKTELLNGLRDTLSEAEIGQVQISDPGDVYVIDGAKTNPVGGKKVKFEIFANVDSRGGAILYSPEYYMTSGGMYLDPEEFAAMFHDDPAQRQDPLWLRKMFPGWK